MPVIRETAALPSIDAESAKSGRILIEVISPGIGSSGYYSAEVLRNAVEERAFGKGCHVYIDHPTESENYARPARTVKDLVGKLIEDAHLDSEGRIVAEVQIFKPFRPLLNDPDFTESVGMSIRASAETRMGKVGEKAMTIITRLIPDRLNSVDVVTHAGRGGRILAVLESLRTPTDSEADATEAAVSDQREALSNALNAAYGGEKSYVGIRDFDPEAGVVWFWHENPTGSGTYQVDYTADESGSITLTGDPSEVRAKTVYVPIATQPTEAASTNVPAPAGQHHPPTESKEDTMPEIEAGRLAQLEEAAGRVPTLASERDQAVSRAEAAEAALRNHRNVDAARGILAEAAAASTTPVTFSALEQRGILAALPTTDAGDLDAAAFRSAVETEVNAKAKQSGAGRVSGFGATEGTGGKEIPTWDSIDSIYGAKKGA